jgi:hypothetical protein
MSKQSDESARSRCEGAKNRETGRSGGDDRWVKKSIGDQGWNDRSRHRSGNPRETLKLANGHLVAVVDGEPKKEVNIPSATRVTPTTERPRALDHP